MFSLSGGTTSASSALYFSTEKSQFSWTPRAIILEDSDSFRNVPGKIVDTKITKKFGGFIGLGQYLESCLHF